MESDSDRGIELLNLNYSDNDNDQELQNLKSNLVEQIKNFKYEVSKGYNDEHKLFTKLHILKFEVESEYVTRENLKVYCDILYELVKRFRESEEETKKEIKEANKELEDELRKLEEKSKKFQDIEQIQGKKKKTEKGEKSEQKSSEENDFTGFFWVGVPFGLSIFTAIGCSATSFIAASLGIEMLVAGSIFIAGFIGAVVAIGFSIWGIHKGINAFINWYRDRNLRKILQKTQEIKEKIQEDAKQKIQNKTLRIEGEQNEVAPKQPDQQQQNKSFVSRLQQQRNSGKANIPNQAVNSIENSF